MNNSQVDSLIAGKFIALIDADIAEVDADLADENPRLADKLRTLQEIRVAVLKDESLVTTNRRKLFGLMGDHFDHIGALHLGAVDKIDEEVKAGTIKSEPSPFMKGWQAQIDKVSASWTTLAFTQACDDYIQMLHNGADPALVMIFNEAKNILSERKLDECVAEIMDLANYDYRYSKKLVGMISDAYQTDGGIVETTPDLPALNR